MTRKVHGKRGCAKVLSQDDYEDSLNRPTGLCDADRHGSDEGYKM